VDSHRPISVNSETEVPRTTEPANLPELLRQAAAGDEPAAQALFNLHHDRLVRMIQLRLDWRLRGRVDPEDILQETYLEAVQRLPGYVADPPMSFALWLRFLAGQKLVDALAPAKKIETVQKISRPATGTPATYGERVYCYVVSFGLLCYDFEGNRTLQDRIVRHMLRGHGFRLDKYICSNQQEST
jgi:DNA-directed RNA polymerase specialized sigma24 family protein